MIGLAWEVKLPPELVRRFKDQNRQVIDTAAPLVLEEEVETPDGRHLTLHTVKFPVRDAAGRIGAVGGISFDISERKRAEAKLVEWTNRYDAAVQATGQILYDWDTASDVVIFSGNCEAILGYSPEEPVRRARPLGRVDSPRGSCGLRGGGRARPIHQAGIRHGLSSPAPRRRLPHGPGRGPLFPQSRRDAGPHGRLHHGHHRADATMEEALREGQATLRTFYDSAPLAMSVVDIHGDDIFIVSANQATANLLGVPTESLQDRYASQVGLSKELLEYWIGRYRESGRWGEPIRFEYNLEWRGERRWIASAVSPISGGRAGRERFAFVAEVITERKRAEETLARDALLLANVRDSVIVTDMEGIVTYWNEGATRLFGWRAEERLGRPLVETVPEAARARMRDGDRGHPRREGVFGRVGGLPQGRLAGLD